MSTADQRERNWSKFFLNVLNIMFFKHNKQKSAALIYFELQSYMWLLTFVGNWIGLSSIRNQSILDDREVFFTLHLREKDHSNMKKQIQQSFLNKGIALWVTHSFWPWLKMSFLVGDPFEFQFSLSLLLLFLRASEVFWKNVFMSRRWKKPCIGKKP